MNVWEGATEGVRVALRTLAERGEWDTIRSLLTFADEDLAAFHREALAIWMCARWGRWDQIDGWLSSVHPECARYHREWMEREGLVEVEGEPLEVECDR